VAAWATAIRGTTARPSADVTVRARSSTSVRLAGMFGVLGLRVWGAKGKISGEENLGSRGANRHNTEVNPVISGADAKKCAAYNLTFRPSNRQ
jgi:hypothetical protein